MMMPCGIFTVNKVQEATPPKNQEDQNQDQSGIWVTWNKD